ncbi:MAG: ketopantoate reductase family protein [Acidobacteriota bacterium]|nr:ketopantoate reductase family protein [Acidobacteriota bacterium]
MSDGATVYVLGAGAIGSALAVHLQASSRKVVLVRTSRSGLAEAPDTLVVRSLQGDEVRATLPAVSLDRLDRFDGILVISAKSYANPAIAAALAARGAVAPLVLLQNGLGVEEPFLAAGLPGVYRCVIFATGEKREDGSVSFGSVRPSPIGVVRGDRDALHQIVQALDTPAFRFAEDGDIRRTVWQKAIINAVFNSICPLLEIDNGVFHREEDARRLAGGIVTEGVAVARSLGVDLDRDGLMQQILAISRGSDGQAISTLQDIRRGRPTEIESLNLEIARVGGRATPPVPAERTELLGRMVALKATLRQAAR